MRLLRDEADFERFLARFTNYERLVRYSYDRKTLGPERTRALLRALGEPERAYSSIHIAGSKGKGSLALMLEAILSALGKRVGTYTSPHVEHLRERIRIAAAPLDERVLVDEMNRLLPHLAEQPTSDGGGFPTFFEIMTALSMASFRSQQVDWGVFEVGLGGRLDATNVLEPRWTAITSIGLEHTQQLGSSLASIAGEKAGIIKAGIPVTVGPVPPEAEAVIRATASRLEAPFTVLRKPAVRHAGSGLLAIAGYERPFAAGAVRGPALRWNLSLALAIVKGLESELGRSLDAAVLDRALSRLTLPARIELIPATPPVVVDGAHTAESVRALRRTLDEIQFPRPRVVVLSTARDKGVDAIVPELRRLGDRFILTCADEQRSIEPDALRDILGAGECIRNPHDAWLRARDSRDAVVITGSFYLAGILRPAVLQQTPENEPTR